MMDVIGDVVLFWICLCRWTGRSSILKMSFVLCNVKIQLEWRTYTYRWMSYFNLTALYCTKIWKRECLGKYIGFLTERMYSWNSIEEEPFSLTSRVRLPRHYSFICCVYTVFLVVIFLVVSAAFCLSELFKHFPV